MSLRAQKPRRRHEIRGHCKGQTLRTAVPVQKFLDGEEGQAIRLRQADRGAVCDQRQNVAAESHFYDFHLMRQDLTIETELSKMEGVAKPLVKSILDIDSLKVARRQTLAALPSISRFQTTMSWQFTLRVRSSLLSKALLHTSPTSYGFSGRRTRSIPFRSATILSVCRTRWI